ncbi:serine/threonine protein phosphatase [Leptospira biflexa]|uniref:PP2C family protein-serine/threonine phosphatase n=1 Tax=Leptospira biflexa TaxID=172 RepID=UPI0010839BA0|nr:SpoIIE family protein phosphatase [Leptospira biflexa]TGM33775.1 serine/threonine protein phosphatase [Leptospira biflexa]TGM35358.1 serine/threonine protein phosphatase [Leptospira biflexa]TGM42509.1 serine/threonine protein phosphatase [Leptospira biflexa]TGM44395.1 serine/threonine protein phosphatase [Leptospira biflexa]TGM57365.1 serine/threonine protein phosphatase [Leptospira biflexa]
MGTEEKPTVDLSFLIKEMKKVEFGSGDLVIEQYTLGDSFYFIEKGCVEVWKYLDETKQEILVIGDLVAGDYFGEISLIDSAPRTVNITTKENSILYKLTREDFHRLIQTSPEMTLTLLKLLTARIRNAEQRENQVLIQKNKELRLQNETLEMMVKERTAKLTQSLKIIQEDLETAKTIQRNILPLGLKHIAHLDFASKFEPMAEVGGDIFDVIRLDKSKIRLFLADAIGHGVQAALITMAIKAEYDHLKHNTQNPSDVLVALNQIFINRYGKKSNQFTAVIVDLKLEENTLVYSSAGHNEPYLLNQTEILPLNESGLMLGLEKDVEYSNTLVPFGLGDRLFMISDGYLEQENEKGILLGESKLLSSFHSARSLGLSLADTVHYLMEEFHTFRGNTPMMDDVTILGIGTSYELGV